jgi:uncharacterized protein
VTFNNIQNSIQEELDRIEKESHVKILYACESGSRAWGFASPDSDYDVRFLYVHPLSWYLTVDLEMKRDVIERPITDELDITGWDLRKALQLMRKSNPPLLEWLDSPTVYRQADGFLEKMRELKEVYFAPVPCAYHYLHMANGNFRQYLRGSEVWRKKYFYVLRPLLAVRWLLAEKGPVPTRFSELLDGTIAGGPLREAIDGLTEEKMAGGELAHGPRNETISSFIESELQKHDEDGFSRKPASPSFDTMNDFFASTVKAFNF